MRGDICYYTDDVPKFKGFLDSYECRALWNYSAIVNPVIEKWVKNQANNPEEKFLIQHTNRVAGGDYIILKATTAGIVAFYKFLTEGKNFALWSDSIDPIESAIADAKAHWKKKWFMDESVLTDSLAALQELQK